MNAKDDLELYEYPNFFTLEFINYCRIHHLPPKLFHDLSKIVEKLPRYIRFRPQYQKEKQENIVNSLKDKIFPQEREEELDENEIKLKIAKSFNIDPITIQNIHWLPRPYYFAIPRNISINSSKMYQNGEISAMDAASIAAIIALRPCKGDIIWDICTSPGMKLTLISDVIEETGIVIGTDININRLFTARSIVKKYQRENVGLFAADGRYFSMHAALKSFDTNCIKENGKYGINGLTAWEERQVRRFQKRLHDNDVKDNNNNNNNNKLNEKNLPQEVTVAFVSNNARNRFNNLIKDNNNNNNNESLKFDRVLVDAECSHDGSLSHLILNEATKKPFNAKNDINITKKEKLGIDNAHRMQRINLISEDYNSIKKLEERNEISSLLLLQLNLLLNGYRQLKPGGILVYCTCSFTYQQNEFIINEMLNRVNLNNETKQKYQGEAVICHPFDYLNDSKPKEMISPLVNLTESQIHFLQRELELGGDPYGIIAAEEETNNEKKNKIFTGVRFWPHIFTTSFQFISKIWKKSL